jgi:hypothetical protein
LNISRWSHAHLDAELTALADAYTLLAHEESMDDSGDDSRNIFQQAVRRAQKVSQP